MTEVLAHDVPPGRSDDVADEKYSHGCLEKRLHKTLRKAPLEIIALENMEPIHSAVWG
jgi:hypothetical protein